MPYDFFGPNNSAGSEGMFDGIGRSSVDSLLFQLAGVRQNLEELGPWCAVAAFTYGALAPRADDALANLGFMIKMAKQCAVVAFTYGALAPRADDALAYSWLHDETFTYGALAPRADDALANPRLDDEDDKGRCAVQRHLRSSASPRAADGSGKPVDGRLRMTKALRCAVAAFTYGALAPRADDALANPWMDNEDDKGSEDGLDNVEAGAFVSPHDVDDCDDLEADCDDDLLQLLQLLPPQFVEALVLADRHTGSKVLFKPAGHDSAFSAEAKDLLAAVRQLRQDIPPLHICIFIFVFVLVVVVVVVVVVVIGHDSAFSAEAKDLLAALEENGGIRYGPEFSMEKGGMFGGQGNSSRRLEREVQAHALMLALDALASVAMMDDDEARLQLVRDMVGSLKGRGPVHSGWPHLHQHGLTLLHHMPMDVSLLVTILCILCHLPQARLQLARLQLVRDMDASLKARGPVHSRWPHLHQHGLTLLHHMPVDVLYYELTGCMSEEVVTWQANGGSQHLMTSKLQLRDNTPAAGSAHQPMYASQTEFDRLEGDDPMLEQAGPTDPHLVTVKNPNAAIATDGPMLEQAVPRPHAGATWPDRPPLSHAKMTHKPSSVSSTPHAAIATDDPMLEPPGPTDPHLVACQNDAYAIFSILNTSCCYCHRQPLAGASWPDRPHLVTIINPNAAIATDGPMLEKAVPSDPHLVMPK
eukprot:gene15038-21109_t